MARIAKLTAMIFLLVFSCININLSAEDVPVVGQADRYVLLTADMTPEKNTVIPALVLDSYSGLVWTCHNVRDARSPWLKTDLGQNNGKPATKKRYTAKVMEGQNASSTLAMVIDNENGLVWICPSIVDAKSIWLKRDLNENQKPVP